MMKKHYIKPELFEYEYKHALMVVVGSKVEDIPKADGEEEGEDPNGARQNLWRDYDEEQEKSYWP